MVHYSEEKSLLMMGKPGKMRIWAVGEYKKPLR
jgi:hypothetical protein